MQEKRNNYGVLQGSAVNSLCTMIIIYVNIEYCSNGNDGVPVWRRCGGERGMGV